MTTELKDVLGFLFQRADAMQTFWTSMREPSPPCSAW